MQIYLESELLIASNDPIKLLLLTTFDQQFSPSGFDAKIYLVLKLHAGCLLEIAKRVRFAGSLH